MASTAFSAMTATFSSTGTTKTSGTVTASGNTCTISGPNGDALDLSSMVIRIANEATGGGALATFESGGSTYSGINVGDFAVTIGTAATVYVGGKGLESARFLDASDQTLIITFTSTSGSGATCACVVEAIQMPFQITG